ncbi:hypothetical protein [Streptomyces sp. NPDC058657]|uniref:hypothetical protein n=1 Tax=unclassified Streptomyces TaxID=2593676 RepID=UPI0036519E04
MQTTYAPIADLGWLINCPPESVPALLDQHETWGHGPNLEANDGYWYVLTTEKPQ